MYPPVTIGLVTHNRASLIRRSIQSVMDQTYSNWALIISDDNSTDGTKEICQEYVQMDYRIKYIRHEKAGMTDNFLKVRDLATTDLFMWLCDDDFLAKDYLDKVVKELCGDLSLLAASGKTVLIREGQMVAEETAHFDLLDESSIKRCLRFIRQSDRNTFLFGLFYRSRTQGISFPNVYGSDLIWTAQLAIRGKMKIVESTAVYYSVDGVSSSVESLSNYFHGAVVSRRESNPYYQYRGELIRILLGNGTLGLSLVQKLILAINAWCIIHERFLQGTVEKKIRGSLKLRTRVKKIFMTA